MNVTKVFTKDYEKKTLSEHGKNKAKTNPNKAKQTQNKSKIPRGPNKIVSIATTVKTGFNHGSALFQNNRYHRRRFRPSGILQ